MDQFVCVLLCLFGFIGGMWEAKDEVWQPLPGQGGISGGFLLLRIFSVAISVSAHVCFILVLILICTFLR